MEWLTPSRKFAITCLAIIAGAVIGSYLEIDRLVIGWVAAIWLIVALSGQDEPIETIAFSLFGLSFGAFLWQITTGEVWLNLAVIGQLSDSLGHLRDLIVDKISLALPEPHGSLMSGILLGNRIKLDKDLIDTFRAVGLTHIIAVSGYNLTILTANTTSIFWPLIGRKALWVSSALILLFVVITGAPASILRAAAMALTVILAKYLGRPSRAVNILIFAAAVLVIFEPKIVFDVGFQLSVAATYGLVRLSPYLNRLLMRTKLPVIIRQIMAETFSAILLTAPLIIGHFERLSVVSPLSNILVLPLIPLVMTIGIIGALLMIIPVFGNTIMLASWPLLTWIVFSSEKLASWQFASTNLTLPAWVIVGLIAVIVGGLEWLNIRRPLQYDLFDRLVTEEKDAVQ
ncbi:MAG: ComEC/Rec2 family competence protein [bacterium]|nr:ComEC/Rec2 family competence protein [bacterium]